MKSSLIGIVCILLPVVVYGADANMAAAKPAKATHPVPAQRPSFTEPIAAGTMTVEEAIAQQKNVRKFSPLALDSSQLRQLAWAAHSTAATAKSDTSIELYFCLSDGVYRYDPSKKTLEGLTSVDVRSMLAIAAQNETALQEAPCVIVVAGSSGAAAGSRTPVRDRMVLNAGKKSQLVELEAASLGLGTLGIDSFDAARIKRITKLSAQQEPLYLLAAGYPVGTTPERAARNLQQNALIIISGSERTDELFTVLDVLTAAAIKTTVAQIGPTKVRTNKYQRAIEPDIQLQDVVINDYDAVIVVGGTGDTAFMRNQTLFDIIRAAVREGKIVGATGGTTQILANAGVLNGVRITGERRQLLRSGGIYTDQPVESDQGIVTAVNDQQSGWFASTIIEAMKNNTALPQQQPATTREGRQKLYK